MYALRSNSKKLISIEAEIKSLIILNLILFFNFEIFFATITNLVCIDKLLLNRRVFLSLNEYDHQTKTFTEKSLHELQLHVLENYDKTIEKLKNKQTFVLRKIVVTF